MRTLPYRRRWFRYGRCLALSLGLALGVGVVSTARAAQSAAPDVTPYQRNPFLFQKESQAIEALSSPDLMMRRSGVEWFGRWTATDGGSTFQEVDADRAALRGRADLVPALSRALQEMPEHDCAQAARLLVLIGEPARSAIPALCDALYHWDGSNFIDGAELANCLVHLCGGPDRLAPTLVSLLNNKEAAVRIAAARGLRYCSDPTFRHTTPPAGAYPYLSPEESRRWRIRFQEQAVPALAHALGDPEPGVSLAAAQSLEQITNDFRDDLWSVPPPHCWNATVAPLSRLVLSRDASLRLAALRVLAFEPVNVSSATRALRDALQRGDAEREYAVYALSHAAVAAPSAVLDAFLVDLGTHDVQRRRVAVDDIRLAAMPLWYGTPEVMLWSKWFGDARLFDYAQKARSAYGQRPLETADVHDRILKALVQATIDKDREVRVSAVSALEQIGLRVCSLRGMTPMHVVNGKAVPIGEDASSKVVHALTLAANDLMPSDPDLAKRLTDRISAFYNDPIQ